MFDAYPSVLFPFSAFRRHLSSSLHHYLCLTAPRLAPYLSFYQNSKSKFLPSPFLVIRVAPISVSLAFGSHDYASTVNATIGDWPSGSTVCFTPMLFPEVQNAKQGNKLYHFSSFWYDWAKYRTPTYHVESEHFTTGPRTRLYRSTVLSFYRLPYFILSQFTHHMSSSATCSASSQFISYPLAVAYPMFLSLLFSFFLWVPSRVFLLLLRHSFLVLLLGVTFVGWTVMQVATLSAVLL